MTSYLLHYYVHYYIIHDYAKALMPVQKPSHFFELEPYKLLTNFHQMRSDISNKCSTTSELSTSGASIFFRWRTQSSTRSISLQISYKRSLFYEITILIVQWTHWLHAGINHYLNCNHNPCKFFFLSTYLVLTMDNWKLFYSFAC